MDRCVRSSRMASQGLRTSKGIAARRPGRQPPCKWLPTGSESLHHRRWPSCRLWRTVEWAGALGVVVKVVPAAGRRHERRRRRRGGQGGGEEGRIGAGRLQAADRLRCARGRIHHGLVGATGKRVHRQPHPQFERRRLQPPCSGLWRVIVGLQLRLCHPPPRPHYWWWRWWWRW